MTRFRQETAWKRTESNVEYSVPLSLRSSTTPWSLEALKLFLSMLRSQKLGVSSNPLATATFITSNLLVQDIDDDQAVTTKGERVMSQRIVSCEKTGELAKKAPTPSTSLSSNLPLTDNAERESK